MTETEKLVLLKYQGENPQRRVTPNLLPAISHTQRKRMAAKAKQQPAPWWRTFA